MKPDPEIQKAIDKLTYNKVYAPDYPSEDRTSIEREESCVCLWLDAALALIRREDVADWVRLGRASCDAAFSKLRLGDRKGSVRGFQFAIQYLQNALDRKPYRVDFVGTPGGDIIIPPSEEDEQQS